MKKYIVLSLLTISILANEKLTQLMLASKIGNLNAVQKLVNDNKTNLDTQTKSGKTALMIALNNSQKHIAKYLIQSGANIHLKNQKGLSALMYAIHRGYENDLLRLLINYEANLNDSNNDGVSPLILAIKNGFKSKNIEYMIDQGADINHRTKDGITPILMAAKLGYAEEIIRLLMHNGVNLNARTPNGWTPLMLIIKNSMDINLVTDLIIAGANKNAKTKDGIDIYLIAKKAKYANLEKSIKKAKAKNQEEIDAANRQAELNKLRLKYE